MFGWQAPEFAHVPMILAADKSKLSKRHGAMGIFEYKKMGYLPEAIINFMVLMGWHPGNDQEIFNLEELVNAFDLKRVQKGGAVFDVLKLNWLNAQYLRRKDDNAILESLKEFYGEEISQNPDFSLNVIKFGKNRMTKLTDFKAVLDSFSLVEYEKDLLIWKGSSPEEALLNLKKSKEILEFLSDSEFNQKLLETKIMALANSAGRGQVFWPLRVALSGKDKSPGPMEIMEVIGKQETLKRIDIAIEKVGL